MIVVSQDNDLHRWLEDNVGYKKVIIENDGNFFTSTFQ